MAQRDDDVVVVDVKTGRESASHVVHVMIYLYAMPRAHEQYRDRKIRGQVTHEGHTVHIPPESVNERFIRSLATLTRRLADKNPAKRVPSAQECRFCDITAADCPQRVEQGSEPAGGTTTDF